jgi:NADH-quinone oxidoreductase subunit L
MNALVVSIPLAPLFGALIAGLFGGRIGRRGAHSAAIAAVGWAFIASVLVAREVIGQGEIINFDWYVWAQVGIKNTKICP